MAELRNDGGALRFVLALVARQNGAVRGGGAPASWRVLTAAGIEYLDARDGEWWPVLRLPPTLVEKDAVDRLLAGQATFLSGGSEGFAWRPDDAAALALQFGRTPAGAVVEMGLDLGPFLAETGGAPARRDAELALFRMQALQADVVRFSDGLARELRELEDASR